MDSLCQYYLDSIPLLESLLTDLRDAHHDPICADEIEDVKNNVERLDIQLTCMSKEIQQGHEHLQNIQLLAQVLTNQSESMRHMLKNLPSRLPKRPTNVRETRSIMGDITSSNASANQMPATKSANTNQNAAPITQTTVPANQQAAVGGRHVNVYFPEIELLTIEEFNQIPKYQKGRITYDQVNKIIEGMNIAYRAKYTLFKKKRSTMSDANRKALDKYKLQETKETKDCYFIVEDDMKFNGGLKIDSITRSIITILRHCGRIREVRGGRLTRYVYIDHY